MCTVYIVHCTATVYKRNPSESIDTNVLDTQDFNRNSHEILFLSLFIRNPLLSLQRGNVFSKTLTIIVEFII